MNWTYKNVCIEIQSDGRFYFTFDGKTEHYRSLDYAKQRIDDLTSFYYKIDDQFVKSLLKKLNSREQDFVKQLFYEIYNLSEYPGYSGGLSTNFLFDIDFHNVGKKLGIIND